MHGGYILLLAVINIPYGKPQVSTSMCTTAARPLCVNGGICLPNGTSFRCLCPPAFRGLDCREDLNECNLANLCSAQNRECINLYGGYECGILLPYESPFEVNSKDYKNPDWQEAYEQTYNMAIIFFFCGMVITIFIVFLYCCKVKGMAIHHHHGHYHHKHQVVTTPRDRVIVCKFRVFNPDSEEKEEAEIQTARIWLK